MPTQLELAYIAGLFDGEGCAYFVKKLAKKRKNKPVKNNEQYTKNSVLNEVMNEVANANEWKTMGDKTHTSEDMNDILAKSYGGMMNGTGNDLVAGREIYWFISPTVRLKFTGVSGSSPFWFMGVKTKD